MSKNAFLVNLMAKTGIVIFFSGKVLKFIVFFGFLYFLVSSNQSLAGYSLNQTIFIFLTFTLVDVVSQFLFRDVYRFRPKVVSGEFDLVLTKPGSSLFRSLVSGADIIDLLTLLPLIYLLFFYAAKFSPNPQQIVLYLLLIANSLLIAAAFHIVVLGMGIVTLSVDHTIMFYRDMFNLGKVPIEVYRDPLRTALTYLIPVGAMVTIPAKLLIGMTSYNLAAVIIFIGLILFYLSLRFYRFSLQYYTSASS